MSLMARISDAGAAALRRLDPEQAHQLAIKSLALAPLPRPPVDDPILGTTLAGLALPNPVGLAAGLDKNGEALRGLSRLDSASWSAARSRRAPRPATPSRACSA